VSGTLMNADLIRYKPFNIVPCPEKYKYEF